MKPICAALLGLAVAASLAGCSGAGARAEAPREAGEELTVRRGSFRQRVLLSGELAAARGEALIVPRTNAFQLAIRWMAEDGAVVKAGDPVVAFDNSQFASDLEEKRLSAFDAGSSLDQAEADAKTQKAEKQFQVEKERSEVAKARIAAAIPKDLLSLREYQERQLALARAQAELAKAEEDLAAQRRGSVADVQIQKITLEKSRREIRTAEEAIEALTLRAPRAGIVLIANHPWEGRKLQVGDTIWVGMTVATLPELSSMIVQASLSDVDDGRIAPGLAALCTLDAYPGVTYRGRVAEISPVARESRRSLLLRSFPVRIDLERSDPRRMRPGMSVRVEVLGPERKDALLVPRAALDLSGARPRALLAAGGASAVRLGPCAANECVVESGLREGTRLRSRDGRSG
ncbi:MAG TPA: efflux RND transporter periplasmic adaptor subunit [Thermoanaerobaculia bacterium]|jgi:multidrug resistance efflux pump|nr:efflux RND transporter periplasmic adaptor subunit [Thermoanaerobaculia bacterium]